LEKLIRERVLQAIKEKNFPGCVVGVVRKRGERTVVPCGTFTFDPNSPNIKETSIFDVASITKVIPTSSLALKLIDEGRLGLEDKLIKYVPELSNSDREKVLIKHLLTHTLEYDFQLSAYKNSSPDEILNVIFSTEFKSRPGTNFFYANATSILLGLVVARILGGTLDELGDDYYFRPLKMTRTTFHPLKRFQKTEIVPTEIQEWRGGLIQGEVHDESAYVLSHKITAGSAGLFSTVPDLLTFLEMLLNEGSLEGHKYFSHEIIQQIETNQIANLGHYAGLGWELNQPWYMGKHCSSKTFGKTGFTGCNCVCDIKRGIGLVILSNYTYPTRKPDSTVMNRFRTEIADIVFENIVSV